MRDLWIPRIEQPRLDERPFIEAPSPFEYLPPYPPERDRRDDEDTPRVIIIDI